MRIPSGSASELTACLRIEPIRALARDLSRFVVGRSVSQGAILACIVSLSRFLSFQRPSPSASKFPFVVSGGTFFSVGESLVRSILGSAAFPQFLEPDFDVGG